MDNIKYLDIYLFHLINNLPHGYFSDGFALFLSGIGSFGLVWFIISFILFFREEKKHHSFFIPIFLSLFSVYGLSELIIKPWIGRLRPTIAIGAIIVDEVSTGFSFPSSHTALSFAAAAVLSQYESRLKYFLYLLALAISLSRIYLGRHFPVDVVAGAILGYSIGKLCITVNLKYLKPLFFPKIIDRRKINRNNKR
jgi:undecaprenyl-diphosphatase